MKRNYLTKTVNRPKTNNEFIKFLYILQFWDALLTFRNAIVAFEKNAHNSEN